MVPTNINTNVVDLSTDIYQVAEFIDSIREQTITDLENTAAMVGIFGYITEVAAQSLQNTLIAISETSNEVIPTRAKFHKNVLAHAMNLAIKDINAKPSCMTVMIYLPLEYVEQNFDKYDATSGAATFILDKEFSILVDSKYEFHLDYDVIFDRFINTSGETIYTAKYDLFENNTTVIKQRNPVSDITNPYITTLIKTWVDGVEYLAFSARVHQVTLAPVTKNILTDNTIENKTITFTFDDQLVTFDVDIKESDGSMKHLTPIYSGLLDYTVDDGEWCYYEYIDENTIRIIFSRDSYVPKLNAEVTINVMLSNGFSGNITYNNEFRVGVNSERYNNYNGMYAIIYPLLNGVANGGKDKKSIADLKKIIPREASSRGSIINTTDLNNFFNSINDDINHLYFYKKRDNPFERLYYAYLITKKKNTVYPTNTLPVKIQQSDFKGFAGNNNLVLPPGTKFYYYDHGSQAADTVFATIDKPNIEEGLDDEEYPYPMTRNTDGNLVRVFEYMSPFLISIDDDLITSYLLTIMNEDKTFEFKNINRESNVQFIATNMNWNRRYVYTDEESNKQLYDDKYIMTMDMVRNTKSDQQLIWYELDGNYNKVFTEVRVKVIMVLYADNKESTPYRYIEGEIIDYQEKDDIYTFQFIMGTDDLMDLNNRINITGIYNAKPEARQKKVNLPGSHGYMYKNTYAKIYILADFGTKPGDKLKDGTEITEDTAEVILYGDDGIGFRTEIENIVPTRADIINDFLKNDIYYETDDNVQINVVNIMKSKPDYMQEVFDYNGNEIATESAILKYLRNNKESEFVQEILLNDANSLLVIESYNYLDLSRFTLCNILSVENGIDFYHDYSQMMNSVVNVTQVQETDDSGDLLYRTIERTDSLGRPYNEYLPIFKKNENGTFYYNYSIRRIPMVKYGFLQTETTMQDYVKILEERRKYIAECLLVLEDTFGLDFKFVNTYGPSTRFYYTVPSASSYKVKVYAEHTNVYSDLETEEVAGVLDFGNKVIVSKANGLWGYITAPYEGWIRLADTRKETMYIDNVSVTLKFACQLESSADSAIIDNITQDIKDYIETINEIHEIHMPNVITLITNNYREQLRYFEFLGVNRYGSECQHLYYDDTIDADQSPEFINVAITDDMSLIPDVTISLY